MTPEEYARVHQKAFRCAFDYLKEHFPPEDDDEWWAKAAKELQVYSVGAGENRLVQELLCAVYEYLDDERKKRKNGNESIDS